MSSGRPTKARAKPSWRYVEEDEIIDDPPPPPTARDARMAKKAQSRLALVLNNLFMLFMIVGMSALNVGIPSSRKQAPKSPQVDEWMEEESDTATGEEIG